MRGPKPRKTVSIIWRPELAYAVGLITTDGNLSKDGRHINFTSKDRVLVTLFKKCLGIKNRVGKKSRSTEKVKRYFQVQFGDVHFYGFLKDIGLTPAKSKTLGAIAIPDRYFFHFLRGHFDGDGTFYSFWDRRWRSSFMFYTVFISASLPHVLWLREQLRRMIGVQGHLTQDGNHRTYHLKYAKTESRPLIHRLYQNGSACCLVRKRLKIMRALSTIS